MNIDDFIFSENAATPAGISLSPQPSTKPAEFQKPTGIPIKSHKDQAQAQAEQMQNQQQFVPQSVPEHHQNPEFNYIKRHQRKTSIDERRVSFCHSLCTLSHPTSSSDPGLCMPGSLPQPPTPTVPPFYCQWNHQPSVSPLPHRARRATPPNLPFMPL